MSDEFWAQAHSSVRRQSPEVAVRPERQVKAAQENAVEHVDSDRGGNSCLGAVSKVLVNHYVGLLRARIQEKTGS